MADENTEMTDEQGADAAQNGDTNAETNVAQGGEGKAPEGDNGADAASGGDDGAKSDTGGEGEDGGGDQPWIADDWRQRLAGDSKRDLKTLERYKSPEDLWTKIKELQKTVSKGVKPPEKPGEDASEAEIKAWRDAYGVPEKWEDYKIELGEGRQLGDDDKPMAESFMQFAHERGFSNENVNTALEWYYTQMEADTVAQAERDDQLKAEADTQLREDWPGADYKRNFNMIDNMFETHFSPELKAQIFGGRMADGTPIGSNPEMLKFLAGVAHEINPASAVMPAGGDTTLKGVEDRITEIKGMMADDHSEYWHGPKSAAIQKEYKELLTAREKMQSRAA